jgi:hypothetical protein
MNEAATTNAPFDLSDLQGMYQEAKPAEVSGGDIPPGTYQAKVDKVELALSQQGNRMLKWQLRILSGQYAGRCEFRQNMLETPQNMEYLKRDLDICGIALQDICELPGILGDLLDVCLEIKVVVKGENRNVYLNKRLTLDVAGADTADDALCPF